MIPQPETSGMLSKRAVWSYSTHKAQLSEHVHESEYQWLCLSGFFDQDLKKKQKQKPDKLLFLKLKVYITVSAWMQLSGSTVLCNSSETKLC